MEQDGRRRIGSHLLGLCLAVAAGTDVGVPPSAASTSVGVPPPAVDGIFRRAGDAGLQEPGEPDRWVESFDLAVPQAPSAVTIDGQEHLVYELHITNFASVDLAITAISVLDVGNGGGTVTTYDDAATANLLGGPGDDSDGADRRVLAPGSRAIAYFWLALDPSRPVPEALVHRIAFREAASADAPPSVVEGGLTHVEATAPPALGAPLRGGPWAAIHHPEMQRGHRRVTFALDGSVRIPARFTVDWFKLDEDGTYATGDASRVDAWHGYGAEVLAVADATVAEVRDSMDESPVVEHVAHGFELEAGNYVTLDLGDGRYVHYEHLQPGSVGVAAGDRVREGDVIARVGTTGDSAGPHLHLHVSDGASPLAGEGVPWELRRFELLGSYPLLPSLAAIAETGRWTPPPSGEPESRGMEHPGAFTVVEFSGSAPDGAPAGSSSQAVVGEPAPAAAIRAVWAQVDATWNAGDAAEFSDLYTHDASFRFVDRGQSLEGRAAIQAHFTEQFASVASGLRHQTTLQAVRTVAPDVQSVDGTVEIQQVGGNADEEPAVLRTFAIFGVMLRTENGWRIRALRIYQLPAPGG